MRQYQPFSKAPVAVSCLSPCRPYALLRFGYILPEACIRSGSVIDEDETYLLRAGVAVVPPVDPGRLLRTEQTVLVICCWQLDSSVRPRSADLAIFVIDVGQRWRIFCNCPNCWDVPVVLCHRSIRATVDSPCLLVGGLVRRWWVLDWSLSLAPSHFGSLALALSFSRFLALVLVRTGAGFLSLIPSLCLSLLSHSGSHLAIDLSH